MTRQRSLAHSPIANPVNAAQDNDHSMHSIGGDNEMSDSSSGDNDGLIGQQADVAEDEAEGEIMGSEDDDMRLDGISVSSSGDDSSAEEYEEMYKGWADLFGNDNPVFMAMKDVVESSRRSTKLMKKVIEQGMNELAVPSPRHVREIKETGIEWVERTLRSSNECYDMYRMRPHVFESLHNDLVTKYGLKSSTKCSSREALGMFLYMVGPPQPVRQADNRFCRSKGTISRKFNHVLGCVNKLAKDIIAPKDPDFRSVHPKVANHRAAPFFNNAIGAIDGTHVKVLVPFEKVGQYINRNNDKTQNALAICDFDRRFTFVAAGVPGSAHDWTVLQAAMRKYSADFPHPPPPPPPGIACHPSNFFCTSSGPV
ncbi:unnamed protein product [Urochloa decumbens]|uniref:DDE Tnp4 domain-containing protein n=1 Tax=Urochloa decumbens TaxID=240449 RepID=A0ABC8WBY9_9POAL